MACLREFMGHAYVLWTQHYLMRLVHTFIFLSNLNALSSSSSFETEGQQANANAKIAKESLYEIGG